MHPIYTLSSRLTPVRRTFSLPRRLGNTDAAASLFCPEKPAKQQVKSPAKERFLCDDYGLMENAKPPAKARLMTAQERQELIAHPPQRTRVTLRQQRDILRGTIEAPADWQRPSGQARLAGSGDAR